MDAGNGYMDAESSCMAAENNSMSSENIVIWLQYTHRRKNMNNGLIIGGQWLKTHGNGNPFFFSHFAHSLKHGDDVGPKAVHVYVSTALTHRFVP